MIDRGVLLVLPRNCSLSPSSTLGATSANNMLHDQPALVWRSVGTAGAYIDVAQFGAWDVIALLGYNGPASAQVRIRAADTLAGVTSSPAIDTTITAYSGAPKATGGMILFRLPAPVSHGFIRIDFADADNADGYIQVSNLVLGNSLEWFGPDIGAEVTYDNQGPSYLRRYRTKPTWKIKLSGLTTADYYERFDDFLLAAGDHRGFLFVPVYNDPYMQKRSAYVSISNASKVTINSSNDYTVELEVSTIQ